MPVKENNKIDIKCKCGKCSVVSFEPATAYCKLTKFICECGIEFNIIDYMNGITTVYTATKITDKLVLEQRKVKK